MPIRFPCNACGQLLGIATRKVGTEICCPTCGLAVIVPDEAQAKLLRQQARLPKQAFPTPDTPPEISIPRERHEAFDGGLESFLTQLEPSTPTSKATSVAPVAKVKASPPKASPPKPTPPKPAPPIATAAPTSNTPPAKVNGSNGTHVDPPRAIAPAIPTVLPKLPPAVKPGQEIPLAFALVDSDISVLSAADMLEVADELVPALTTGLVAAPPAAKAQAAPVPPKQKPAVPAPAKAPEVAPLVEFARPIETDAGFDFSAPLVASPSARKQGPAPAPTVPVSHSVAAIPAAPFENAVWISRRAIYTHVAILVLVSIVTFLIGWISGGAGARLPVGSNAGPVRFEAQIQYIAANGKTLPDEGAVVLLWPKSAKPLERLSSKRLSPAEPPPPSDHPTIKALETLRGAYARTNAQGEVRDLLLAEPGEYYVLVISRNLARPANEPINEKAIPILGDLFGADALTLLGTRQFTLKSYMIADTRTLSHTFGALAEPK